MLHGWKEDSMLVKCLAAYTHLSSTISEIYQVIGRKLRHFHTPPLFIAPPHGLTPSEFREDLDTHRTRMNGLSCGEESMTIYSRFDTIPACDGQTDRKPVPKTCISQNRPRNARSLSCNQKQTGTFLWFTVYVLQSDTAQ